MPKSPIRKPGYSVEQESWYIPLTKTVIALVDADMVPILAQHNWYANKIRRCWVAVRAVKNSVGKQTALYMHRLITEAQEGMEVDHIIHHPLDDKVIDNRRSNLRVCTSAENQRNQRPQHGRSSPYKGVCWDKQAQKWHAQIRINGKRKYLGRFDCEEAAARAYDVAAVKHYGNFARTNAAHGLLPDEAA